MTDLKPYPMKEREIEAVSNMAHMTPTIVVTEHGTFFQCIPNSGSMIWELATARGKPRSFASVDRLLKLLLSANVTRVQIEMRKSA